jgi:hypothetical protein
VVPTSGMPQGVEHPDLEFTPRGFRVFGRLTDRDGEKARLQESSLAFEGPHARLFLENQLFLTNRGGTACLHLNLAQAEALAAMLFEFVRAARAGELTEKPSNP